MRILFLIAVAVFFAGQIKAQQIAYINSGSLPPNGLQTTGGQGGQPFALGLEFTVNSNSAVVISQLGAYDATIGSSGLGFGSPVQVGIFSEASQSFVSPTVTFSGTVGSVAGSYRFQSIPDLTLYPGTYMVVAAGYGIATAPDWNAVVAGISPSPIQLNGGGGALTMGSSWYANNGSQLQPAIINGGAGALFAAGSFVYTVSVLQPASSSFTFILDEPSKTSAGVFKPDGTLIRTLWSKVRYAAGTNSAVWDGLDDNGNVMPAGIYQIKLLQHNTEYVWDGAIGNTSAEASGPTVHRGFYPMRDMVITGTNAFYVTGYNEGGYDFHSFLTTDPQHVKAAWYWVYSPQFDRVTSIPATINDRNWIWTTTDGNWVYFACDSTLNPTTQANNYPGCVIACKVSDNSPGYFTTGGLIPNGSDAPLPNGIYVGTQPGLSGLSVQQNGNLLAVAIAPDNRVYIRDKQSGAAVTSFSVSSPKRLNFSPDGNLWVISGNSVICYTNLNSNPSDQP